MLASYLAPSIVWEVAKKYPYMSVKLSTWALASIRC